MSGYLLMMIEFGMSYMEIYKSVNARGDVYLHNLERDSRSTKTFLILMQALFYHI